MTAYSALISLEKLLAMQLGEINQSVSLHAIERKYDTYAHKESYYDIVPRTNRRLQNYQFILGFWEQSDDR